jgi:hypothetical protein
LISYDFEEKLDNIIQHLKIRLIYALTDSDFYSDKINIVLDYYKNLFKYQKKCLNNINLEGFRKLYMLQIQEI